MFVVIIFAGSLSVIFNYNKTQVAQNILKNDKTPSVFLSFEKIVTRESRCKGESGKSVLLRLNNNTENPLNVGANFSSALADLITKPYYLPDTTEVIALNSNSEVSLCYEVEGTYVKGKNDVIKKTSAPKRDPFCSCSWLSDGKELSHPSNIGVWVLPNESIIFSVPLKFLSQNLKIYTEFHYFWEFNNGKLNYFEPSHKVYFYYYDLPEGT